MSSRRVLKVAEAIREVVSMAILTELQDPRIRDVTVTYVEVSADLRHAKVHVSIMGDEAKQKLSLHGLQNASGFLQQKVGNRVDTRYTPRIKFILDQGVKHSLEVTRILEEVLPKEPANDDQTDGEGRAPTEFPTPIDEADGACMSAPNRAAILTKTFKLVKKHYQAVAPPRDRSVLEHLMYACCLENSKHEVVDDVLAKLQENFFDWNEVRVTTRAELAEVMSGLSDPADSAGRLKRTLHSVFETYYSFDLEFLRKQNLGKSVKDLQSLNGTTPFTIAYLTQNALGGHSIPVNHGVLHLLFVLGVISQAEANKSRVPGLERAVPKSNGVELGSLLHQLGVDFANSPFSPRVRSLVLEIDPEAKDRLPKRSAKKEPAARKAQQIKGKKSVKAGPPPGKPKAAKKTAPTGKKKKKSTTKRLTRKKPR